MKNRWLLSVPLIVLLALACNLTSPETDATQPPTSPPQADTPLPLPADTEEPGAPRVPQETAESEMPEDGMTITFQAGEIRGSVQGVLLPREIKQFDLAAAKGQEMVVSLVPTPPGTAIVVIWGTDGTVLISDHAGTAYWVGVLPSTQEYHIKVVSGVETRISYRMEVIIPPAGISYIADYARLNQTECDSLTAELARVTRMQALYPDYALFENPLSGKAGTGCNLVVSADGAQIADWGGMIDAVSSMLGDEGFTEDPAYAAGGPGALLSGYKKDKAFCLFKAEMSAIEPGLCPSDQPVAECWDNLEPEQLLYTLSLNCVQEK